MDVLKFFDDYISKYPPYQNNRFYQILIDKFKEVFLKDTYDDIPTVFKKLYENGEIPVEIYDYFLTDIGVSKDLVKELTNNEKLIFIKSLSDFQKIKSTVQLVENVIRAYGNNVEVYELYIDYNKLYNRWDCKPYPIYKPEHSDGYNKTIPYSLVYEKIPSLLVHEKQLDLMRELNLAVFPIKTNIIFLTSNYNQSVTGYIQNLIISVFYKHYYNTSINLYFSDQLLSCSLHQFVLIWLYLLFSKNTNNHIAKKLNGLYITFNKDLLDITLEELDSILEEYNNIETSTELDSFYFQYIYSLTNNITSSNDILNKAKIENWLKNENPELISYIQQKLSESDDNISILFSDLINSIENYKKISTDVNFVKYFSYFKSFLPTVDLLPSQNTIYKILYYLKPFHTEFLDLVDLSFIKTNDKFNNIYFDHIFSDFLFFEQKDVIEVETLQNFNMFKKIVENIGVVSAFSGSTYLFGQIEGYEVDDDFTLLFSESTPTELQDNYSLYGW